MSISYEETVKSAIFLQKLQKLKLGKSYSGKFTSPEKVSADGDLM